MAGRRDVSGDVDPADEDAVFAQVALLWELGLDEQIIMLFERMLADPTPSLRARRYARQIIAETAEPPKAYHYAKLIVRDRPADPASWQTLERTANALGKLRMARFARMRSEQLGGNS